MKTHALILLSIVIISCTNNKTNYNNVLLTEKTLPEVKELELEKIDLPEDYSIGSICYVYKDTILLVLKRDNPYPLTHMLTLFNMKTWNKIGEYFTRGQGPHDFLSLTGFIGGNRLDLCCHNSAKIVSFNIDSALTYGYEYTPHIITHKDEGLLDFRYFGNGSFLISNMFYFDGCQKYKTDTSVPEFYIINSKGEYSPPPKSINFEKLKHFPANVTGCEITVNRERQRVVCCYHYQPHIKVFDLDMKPIRQISGPEPDDAEYTIVHDNMLFFSEHTGINHYYFQSFHDSNNIFVKNRRNHADKSYGGVYIEKEKLTSEIWRLNWEGDIIGRYCAKRYDVIYVTYSIASNTIYLWLDANGEHALYKAKLD